jgi:hypothetical protein
MAIVGFNFTGITVEKKDMVKEKINISSNVEITGVEKTDLSLGDSKQEAVKFLFRFDTTYTPNVGSINLLGNVIYIAEGKKVKELIDQWKKSKKADPKVIEQVLNTILSKSNIEALLLSKEVNLPSPLEMPKMQQKQ